MNKNNAQNQSQNQNQNKARKPSLFKRIKKNVILLTFCINILVCFCSCAYFGAAQSKMNEIRDLREAREFAESVLETPDLTSEWDIKELEAAVNQDIEDAKRNGGKKPKPRPMKS